MTETTILWLFGTLIGLQTAALAAVCGAIWKHVHDCRDFRESIATAVADIKGKLDRVEKDIGTHDSGLRGQLHKLRGEITPFILWAQLKQETSRKNE